MLFHFPILYHFPVLISFTIAYFKATFTFPNDRPMGHISYYILIDLFIAYFIDYISNELLFLHPPAHSQSLLVTCLTVLLHLSDDYY